jgi:hypothetical protein
MGPVGIERRKPATFIEPKIQHHHCDRQLHAEPDPHRDHEIEENDCSADHEDGDGVANAPKCPDQGCAHTVALITDNGCDRNDVVGSVAWRIPKKNPTREWRES